MLKYKLAASIVLLTSYSLCATEKLPTKNTTNVQQKQFFAQLSELCGNTYVGKTLYPNIPTDSMVGVKLTINFQSCSESEIRVPFHVGEDKSRTWIISQTNKGLLLKHDHRHKDGSPDEITMYGGYANDQGSLFSQSFQADEQTAQLIPAAKSNVWQISIDQETKTLTYYLERNSKKRYKAIFELN
jgi:hypothetical protein